MEASFTDVRCPNCGAPARYDIIRQQYLCGYCGSKVGIKEALAEKQGFRLIRQQKIKESVKKYKLLSANCSGCGAKIVFEENEALSNCAFCGRALVRKDYVQADELPELIIPFGITKDEAKECVKNWCSSNKLKPEAKHLSKKIDEINGFYLPYELVKGPVSCNVSRKDSNGVYECEGYVDKVFVNCSKQLDNRLLDAMEPYELNELVEFDLGYVAGQRVKVGDINGSELLSRVSREVSEDYLPVVRKTLESKSVDIDTSVGSALRMPVLLPVYYINSGDTVAAINGQTGKVSIMAEKPSHIYFVPWWIKAIGATLAIGLIAFLSFLLFKAEPMEALLITGMLMIVTLIITLCVYSDTVRNKFRVETEKRIFTSDKTVTGREGRSVVYDDKKIEKEIVAPVFFENLDGKEYPVKLVFTSPLRILKTALLALVVLFLPVIIALFLNGFDFKRLELGGSAVWFCIMVPVVPIYVLKFAIVELYERPWIYILEEDGSKRRYHRKPDTKLNKEIIKDVLRAMFIPPISFAIWAGILCFCIMCYLTAFGFN